MDRGPLHPRLRDPLLGRGLGLVLAGVALLGVTLLFWKLRIIDTAVVDSVNIANADIFVGQAPMTRYAFSSLLEGRLPLWNPYQFCGAPFLAVTYVGLFYPLNWLHLWVDPAVGFELSFVLVPCGTEPPVVGPEEAALRFPPQRVVTTSADAAEDGHFVACQGGAR